jgi:protein-S-isoprenylcysteine O-methyltransferase Ste14
VSFVRWYEEPTLRQRFGPTHDSYRASVPGWVPRLPSQAATPLGHDHGSR